MGKAEDNSYEYHGEQFRMFSDNFDVLGCDLFPVPDTLLDEILGIF